MIQKLSIVPKSCQLRQLEIRKKPPKHTCCDEQLIQSSQTTSYGTRCIFADLRIALQLRFYPSSETETYVKRGKHACSTYAKSSNKSAQVKLSPADGQHLFRGPNGSKYIQSLHTGSLDNNADHRDTGCNQQGGLKGLSARRFICVKVIIPSAPIGQPHSMRSGNRRNIQLEER